MEEKKQGNIVTITIVLLIIAMLIGIVFLGIQHFDLTDKKKNNEKKIKELKNKIKELEDEQGFSSSNSSIEIGYDYIISVLDGNPYIIPINKYASGNNTEEEGLFYYHKFEVEGLSSLVKRAYMFQLGLDPSSSIYLLMEDGSVRNVSFTGSMPNVVYSSSEVVSKEKEVEDIKLEDGKLNAICKDGSRIKITESES